jgi:hypothetical protein
MIAASYIEHFLLDVHFSSLHRHVFQGYFLGLLLNGMGNRELRKDRPIDSPIIPVWDLSAKYSTMNKNSTRWLKLQGD